MKKLLFIACLCIAYIVTTSSGCKNNEDNKITPGNANSPFPQSGDWKITYYSDKGNVETADYADYTFDFKPANAITATIATYTSAGDWSIGTEENRRRLSINFNTGDPKLSEISDNWVIISVSETEVKLMDDNDAHEEFLDFTRQ